MKIPKIIHHIWVGNKPMPAKLMQSWKDKHPDYQYILWDNEAVRNRKWRCEKQIEQMWLAERWNGVADILRYEILYDIGGFVAPADSVCLNPIDDLLDLECFCCYENEKIRANLLSPHIGTYPENPFLNFIVETIQNSDDVLYDEVWKITGNALLTGAVQKYNYPIVILPSYMFIPEHYTGNDYEGEGKIYARHFWGSTHEALGHKDFISKLDEQI